MLTIGKIASLTGLTTDAVRYYEREGLILPLQKSDSGYRLYDERAIQRLHFIKQAQHCGFSLADISQLLRLKAEETACCSDVRKLAIEKKLQLEAKIRAMKAMSATLDQLIGACAQETLPVDACAILASLEGAKHDPH